MFCVPTPYYLREQAPEDERRDVWAEIYPESVADPPVFPEKSFADYMKARYDNQGIGNLDVDYWVRCMTDRAGFIYRRYDMKIKAWEALETNIANTGPDYTESKMTSRSTQKLYDPPETDVTGKTAEDYLADQNVNDFEQSSESGLETVTVREWMDGVTNPYEEYVEEFRDLFYRGL